jgi:hypothetical protein
MRPRRVLITALAGAALTLLVAAVSASASKEVIAFFGGAGTDGGQFGFLGSTQSGDIAVNASGSGPADPGDLYVVDDANFRIQRFALDDGGTPADPYDDTYDFRSAWGADVVADGGSGDLGDATDARYEICTVATECKQAVGSAGNGSADGNGSLSNPVGIAVDQDTGRVFVSDSGNNRVSVYAGDGSFERSFGFDVAASGPGDTGAGYEVCVAADGDVCQIGLPGSGAGQLDDATAAAVSPADGNPTTGTVFVADLGNSRIGTYGLDGAAPSAFGSSAEFPAGNDPFTVAVDSRGIVYADDRSNGQRIQRYDSTNANGGGVGFLAPLAAPGLPVSSANGTVGLEVNPDSDGPGSDEDVLYVLRSFDADPTPGGADARTVIYQFGPANPPGLTAPPATSDDIHGQLVGFPNVGGLGLDPASGRLFVSSGYETKNGGDDRGVYVLDTAGGAPTGTVDSVSDLTATSATVNATVDPNGPPPVSYRLEYSTDGSTWLQGPSDTVGSQDDPQSLAIPLDPPGTGLSPATLYHVRLQVSKIFAPPVTTSALTFTTLAAPPDVETTGAPIRSATTAQLTGRVNPRGSATNYHFEYGDQGPCDANPCTSTPAHPAGAGQLVRLAAERVTGLAPATAYHYRLVADNGAPGSPTAGADQTATTRASDAPLSNGDFPGPPASDRAWELVSAPDTSGNPVGYGLAFALDGERAAYQVLGGTPESATGSAFSIAYAERPSGAHPTAGWQYRPLEPLRSELAGQIWAIGGTASPDDLSQIYAWNDDGVGAGRFFRLTPGGAADPLVDGKSFQGFSVAADGSTVAINLVESYHPAHPAGSGSQVYDLSSGTPELLSFLPNGSVSSCGSGPGAGARLAVAPGVDDRAAPRYAQAVSDDGSLVFFSCSSVLYVRDLDLDQTTLIGSGSFVKATVDAVFFNTSEDLAPEDAGGQDVYRYQLGGGGPECLTCLVPGLVSGVDGTSVAVADDGSRVYFSSGERLVPGVPAQGIYRVDVASGELAFVAASEGLLADQSDDTKVGESNRNAQALSADGTKLLFRSNDPSLDPLGGQTNGATQQYYLYDDVDRSLTCVSCPLDGAPPLAAVEPETGGSSFNGLDPVGTSPLADDGTLAFVTTSPLLGADQNTPAPGQDLEAGADVYEYRDGRPILVTDGITSWPGVGPRVQGISPSGRDLFFIASARYTADALDDNGRLYDARSGGGIDLPEPPPDCPLEACQGDPAPPPDDPGSGTSGFVGPGNQGKDRGGSEATPRRCGKGKKLKRGKCVKKKRKRAKGRARG